MISSKIIKEIANKENKKVGKDVIKKIEDLLEEQVKLIIKKAARRADFDGRVVVKAGDVAGEGEVKKEA